MEPPVGTTKSFSPTGEITGRFKAEAHHVKLRKMPKLLIKGTLTQIGEAGEFEDDIVYVFKISPLGQDKNGDDRVFTFNCYSKASHRNSPKHSTNRKHLALLLRTRHTNIWNRLHKAMGTR